MSNGAHYTHAKEHMCFHDTEVWAQNTALQRVTVKYSMCTKYCTLTCNREVCAKYCTVTCLREVCVHYTAL